MTVAFVFLRVRSRIPRTSEGRPDLQGDWTNATLTPIERPSRSGPTLSRREVAALEARGTALTQSRSARSDPERGPPPEGGIYTGDAFFDAATGGTGGYNYVYVNPGDEAALVDGEYRSSLITRPGDGRIPNLTAEGRERLSELRRHHAGFGEFDHPENRPLSERCILSFGSNAGPPMLPNYFYNNNYTIVQTSDHVMVMSEMVHDVRIIRLEQPDPLPDHIRPWFGDSWGRWEGDTLVVETTHVHPDQLDPYAYIFPTFEGGSEKFKVIERFTLADAETLHYEFTVVDSLTYTEPWGGEVPFKRLDGRLYEYACHEANYSMFNVLSGARAQEGEGP